MGRESRQARRHRQRRQQARHQQHMGTSRWAVLAGSGVIAAVIIVLVVLAVRGNQNNSSNGSSQANNVGVGPTIDGIQCNSSEQATYHIHGHLDIIVNGKTYEPPPYVGEDINHDCLYWVHIHQPSYGVLHVEAPHKVEPTLRNFFDIWHQPFNSTTVWKFHTKPGQSMRVYLNEKLYHGDPNKIKILPHTDIAIEIGPPWVKPKRFNYKLHGI